MNLFSTTQNLLDNIVEMVFCMPCTYQGRISVFRFAILVRRTKTDYREGEENFFSFFQRLPSSPTVLGKYLV